MQWTALQCRLHIKKASQNTKRCSKLFVRVTIQVFLGFMDFWCVIATLCLCLQTEFSVLQSKDRCSKNPWSLLGSCLLSEEKGCQSQFSSWILWMKFTICFRNLKPEREMELLGATFSGHTTFSGLNYFARCSLCNSKRRHQSSLSRSWEETGLQALDRSKSNFGL